MELRFEINRLLDENGRMIEVPKCRRQMKRDGVERSGCAVKRVMKQIGMRGERVISDGAIRVCGVLTLMGTDELVDLIAIGQKSLSLAM